MSKLNKYISKAKGWGDESATVNVIAIHGFLDSAASFDRLAPLLVSKSKGNIRVVAVDLSGHGKSAHRPDYSNYFSGWITEGFNFLIYKRKVF